MFDIGFPELLLISVVALLVIGPDRLPETIRAIALWIGRFKQSFASIKTEIEKEIGADEIRQQLHNESIMADIEKSRSALTEVEDQVRDVIDTANKDLKATTEIDQADESKQSNA